MKHHKLANKLILFLSVAISSFAFLLFGSPNASALDLTVSPMSQKLSLVPGETISADFRIFNPSETNADLVYEIEIQPFTKDTGNNVQFEAKEDYSQIVDWITVKEPTGVLAPGEGRDIEFTITPPANAPAGGQYAAIIVKSPSVTVGMVNQTFSIGHLIYADVSGKTKHSGKVNKIEVPTFLFSGNIVGAAEVTNDGNVHTYAIHNMAIYPLFSSDPVFANPSDSNRLLVMPESSRTISLTWESTPSVGIFRVVYSVDIEEDSQKIEKLVFVCPLWLLLIIIFTFLFLLVLIINRFIKRKKEPELLAKL